MKDQDSMHSSKSTRSIEMFFNENYLHELQNTEFKRTLMNFITEPQGVRKIQETQLLSDAQEIQTRAEGNYRNNQNIKAN